MTFNFFKSLYSKVEEMGFQPVTIKDTDTIIIGLSLKPFFNLLNLSFDSLEILAFQKIMICSIVYLFSYPYL